MSKQKEQKKKKKKKKKFFASLDSFLYSSFTDMREREREREKGNP